MVYVYLIIGFLILIKGGSLFVDGAASLARNLRVSLLVIGLTVVAFGTSAPEAVVSIIAASNNHSDIAFGNVIGSNLINISLIIGIAAFIAPIKVNKQAIVKEIPLALVGAIVLLIMISDVSLFNRTSNSISRVDGLILFGIFLVFLIYIINIGVKNKDSINEEESVIKMMTLKKSIILTILGLSLIIFGGELVLRNSIVIAENLGMSETLVGLTIVAMGTSLPELVTAITAAIKKQSEIAFGNVIGSNIFNTFFVVGISGIISPIQVEVSLIPDLIFMILLSLFLLVFAITQFKTITSKEGMSLIAIYLIYLTFLIFR
jgi:cation:H+ antiporter